jgi:hypothetical protein
MPDESVNYDEFIFIIEGRVSEYPERNDENVEDSKQESEEPGEEA